MNSKTLVILAGVAVVAVGGAYVALRGDKPTVTEVGTGDETFKGPLFPDLAGKVDQVAAITVKTASGESSIEKDAGGKWSSKERSGYPVDTAKVRELVLRMAELKDLKIRTSVPEKYAKLGVEDPGLKPAAQAKPDADPMSAPAASQALLVTLKDSGGQAIASLIVGNTDWGGGGGGSQGVYIRKSGDATSYRASGQLQVPREANQWIETQFADIKRDRVWSVVISPPEGDAEKVTVLRDKPDGVFAIQGIPEGKELKTPGSQESIVSGLGFTTFDDVRKADAVDFAGSAGGKPGSKVLLRTWDGLLVNLESTEVEGKTWWKLAAAADPEPFKEGEGDAAKPKRTAEEVNKEVGDLNAKWSGWAYAPVQYKATAFKTKMSEQIKDKAPAADAGAAPANPQGGMPALPPGFPAPSAPK